MQVLSLFVAVGLLITTIGFIGGVVNLIYIVSKPLFRKIEKHFINVFEIGASAGFTLLGFLNPTFAIIIIAMLVVGAVADLLLTEWEKGNIKFPSLNLKPIAVAGLLLFSVSSYAVDLENVRQEDLIFNQEVTEIVGYRTGSDFVEIEPIAVQEYENFNPHGTINTVAEVKAWHLVTMLIGSVGVYWLIRKIKK